MPSRFFDSRIGINRLQSRPGKRATFLKLDKNDFIEGVYRNPSKGQICTSLSRTNRSYIPAFRQTECEHAIGNLRVDD